LQGYADWVCPDVPGALKEGSVLHRALEIQGRHGGRIGVSLLLGDGSRSGSQDGKLGLDSDQRFAMCSTFKWLLAARVLKGVDHGEFSLQRSVFFTRADVLSYAPVTSAHLSEGKMTLFGLCAAMVEQSDNTAANLVLGLVGGPAGLTSFVREMGDTVTRFDRSEPSLNSNLAGDIRDTTTPLSMATLLRSVYSGSVLSASSLEILKTWMLATATGKARIRAGVPKGYLVADKTGTGENGAVNDVAVIWPTGKPPVFMAIYTSGGHLGATERDKVVADLTRLAFDTLGFVKDL